MSKLAVLQWTMDGRNQSDMGKFLGVGSSINSDVHTIIFDNGSCACGSLYLKDSRGIETKVNKTDYVIKGHDGYFYSIPEYEIDGHKQ